MYPIWMDAKTAKDVEYLNICLSLLQQCNLTTMKCILIYAYYDIPALQGLTFWGELDFWRQNDQSNFQNRWTGCCEPSAWVSSCLRISDLPSSACPCCQLASPPFLCLGLFRCVCSLQWVSWYLAAAAEGLCLPTIAPRSFLNRFLIKLFGILLYVGVCII